MAKRDKRQLRNRIAIFLQKYARKAEANTDPNDRSYDRDIQRIIRKMKSEELDRLMREDEEEDVE